jgi:sigma-E factor negative regulatory protein RseC
MDVRQGFVRRVSDGFAWVEIPRMSGCGRCAEPGGCGSACSAPPATYVIPVDAQIRAGQEVSVSVPHSAPLIAALMSYGVALLALFAGALLGRAAFGGSDVAVAAGAAAGLASAVLWLRTARPRTSILPVLLVRTQDPPPIEP